MSLAQPKEQAEHIDLRKNRHLEQFQPKVTDSKLAAMLLEQTLYNAEWLRQTRFEFTIWRQQQQPQLSSTDLLVPGL